jgi:uncharacterized iron-regulated membrane protein
LGLLNQSSALPNISKIKFDRHRAEATAGDIVLAWQFPLHSGKAFGWAGRIIIFLAGIGVCIFSVTGIMIWMRKRRARIATTKRRMD